MKLKNGKEYLLPEYDGVEFYDVEYDDGIPYIVNIFWFFDNGEEIEEGKPARCQSCGCEISMSEYAAMSEDERNNYTAEENNYIDDLTPEEAQEQLEAAIADYNDEIFGIPNCRIVR